MGEANRFLCHHSRPMGPADVDAGYSPRPFGVCLIEVSRYGSVHAIRLALVDSAS